VALDSSDSAALPKIPAHIPPERVIDFDLSNDPALRYDPTALLRLEHEDPREGSGGSYEHCNQVTGGFQAQVPLAGKSEIEYLRYKTVRIA
jgi:hypothetical protein